MTTDLGTFTPPLPRAMTTRELVADLVETVRACRAERALFGAVRAVETRGADPLAYVLACEDAREVLARRGGAR